MTAPMTTTGEAVSGESAGEVVAEDELATLRASPALVDGWRSMNSAPEDGTEFIASYEGWSPFSCRWDQAAR